MSKSKDINISNNDTPDYVNIFNIAITDGSSNSLIGKGRYNDNDIYLKIFTNSKSTGLLYEKKVYEYLLKKFEEENTDIINFFIKPLKTFEIDYDPDKKLSYLNKLISGKKLSNITKLFGIITIDNKGDNLLNSILELINDDDDNNTIMLFFNLLYIIYVLNIKLEFMHNDLHFNNIIYIKEDKPNMINYNFNKHNFTLPNNCSLKIFDYDYSYIRSIGNNDNIIQETCEEFFGACNKITKKDIWTLLVNTIIIYLNDFFPPNKKDLLLDIIKTISNDSKNLDIFIETIDKYKGIHKHRLCNININDKEYIDKCGDEFEIFQDLNIVEIIEKYYLKYQVHILKISVTHDFEHKYLKYKNKYNKLKNLIYS